MRGLHCRQGEGDEGEGQGHVGRSVFMVRERLVGFGGLGSGKSISRMVLEEDRILP